MTRIVMPGHIDVTSHKAWRNEAQVHDDLRYLRVNAPVSWVDREPYRPFWAVTRIADIKEVMQQNELFINEPRLTMVPKNIEALTEKQYGGRRYAVRILLDMDGPEHKTYRSITQRWFMGPGVIQLQKRIDVLADRYIQEMIDAGGEIDFSTRIASQLPLTVILSILGMPDEDAPFILKMTQELLSTGDPELARSDQGGVDVMADVAAYFGRILAERRAAPREDLTSVIANAMVHDEAIGALEAISYYLLISTAGHETTAASIAGGLLAFIQNPAELEKVKRSPGVLRTGADEIVRWVSPIRHFMRTATQDCVLGGVEIKAGDSLAMLFPSANRDDVAFADAYRFDIERAAQAHVGFGWGGHACLGRQIALAEIRTFFAKLLPRLESIELAGEARPIESNFTGGYKSLPIRYRIGDAG
ncbi:Cytochrome P450 [Collimonas sp. OK607]|uniref:cytochrome P450 n=1 Tax=Collimonas sp. OK607 TaxID=1798194 RepID=UPI0008E11784|nr:cytochrome P450 [Collimonas sp. OK607]SFA82893.1 Cytochrome P450 [Collimonas sp. OK607]